MKYFASGLEKNFKNSLEYILQCFVTLGIDSYQTNNILFRFDENLNEIYIDRVTVSITDSLFDGTCIEDAFQVHLSDGKIIPLRELDISKIIILLFVLERELTYKINKTKHGTRHSMSVFGQDIIITDPCYIIKKSSDDDNKVDMPYPNYNDFDLIKKNNWDVSKLTPSQILRSYRKQKEYSKLMEKRQKSISESNDWAKCGYGSDMGKLGITNYIISDTLYGDWSCTTFDSDSGESLGNFCADAGMVSVFLLDEVLKYNPDFDYHIKRPWTTTLIKNFTGKVWFEKIDKETLRVMGKGTTNFLTKQTGF